jgi:hypothetical protein
MMGRGDKREGLSPAQTEKKKREGKERKKERGKCPLLGFAPWKERKGGRGGRDQ